MDSENNSGTVTDTVDIFTFLFIIIIISFWQQDNHGFYKHSMSAEILNINQAHIVQVKDIFQSLSLGPSQIPPQ